MGARKFVRRKKGSQGLPEIESKQTEQRLKRSTEINRRQAMEKQRHSRAVLPEWSKLAPSVHWRSGDQIRRRPAKGPATPLPASALQKNLHGVGNRCKPKDPMPQERIRMTQHGGHRCPWDWDGRGLGSPGGTQRNEVESKSQNASGTNASTFSRGNKKSQKVAGESKGHFDKGF